MIYICTNCDAQFPKWSGRCLECGKWGTLEIANKSKKPKENEVSAGKVIDFEKVKINKNLYQSTGLKEIDRVLGQGIVKGSLILLGGDPGIGKSTLALQMANSFKGKALYISAEESAEQVKLRLERLKKGGTTLGLSVQFLAEEEVEVINKTIVKEKPDLVVIDSIQTVFSEEVAGELGGVNQIRAATVKFLETAKEHQVPIVLIGHVTKEGALAGPRSLEHLVDVVLYLEGDGQEQYRLLRGVKNRFGSCREVGVFDMQEQGLVEVSDPTKIFLSQRSDYPGSCLTAVLEGTRVFLVEIQALVSKTVFGYPVRKTSGYDANRLQMLLAVLTKRLKLPLGSQDVHINVVGGLKIKEPAADLAVCLSIISAFSDKALPQDLVALGEVGLGGEIRGVARASERIKQIKSLGYQQVLTASQAKNLSEVIKKI